MPATGGARRLAAMSRPESPKHSRIGTSHRAPSRAIGADGNAGLTCSVDWMAIARELGPDFAARAHAHDADNSFVADNYLALKARKVFSAGVPTELGGGGASHAELCAMLRELGRACGSTALALSMHTHLVAANVWRYRQGQSVEPFLRRIAA